MRLTPIGKLLIALAIFSAVGAAIVLLVRGRPSSVGESTPPSGYNPTHIVTTPAAPDSGVGPAIARIRARGELLVAMDTGEPPWTGTPPMYFPDEKGDPDGFDYQLARRIAQGLGVPAVKIVHSKYSQALDTLAVDGGPDLLISGFSPTEHPGVAWSESYLEYGLCLVVPTKSKVKTTADLWGKAVGIFDDDDAAEQVTAMVKGFTELVRLEDGYWDQLIAGRFAGFIYDYPYAAAEIAQFYRVNPHRKGALRIAQFNLSDSTYAVGVRANEPELTAVVNSTIREFRAGVDYPELVRRYLASAQASLEPVATEGRTVVVKAGETLSLIAARELGDAGRWQEVWALNKQRFPNPHLIEVGDRVVVP